ncbi:hypothetical protein CASFOL_028269 [Castilleja foliolosa]|uniref:Uncharacterized protein n=1 Tax=Castilleja foliolosa TaxID=1961234 RepID=A0ABD3CE79_9LAMI
MDSRVASMIRRLGYSARRPGKLATPKSLMRVMGINGLTLYHLKSHLQNIDWEKANNLKLINKINKFGAHEEIIRQVNLQTRFRLEHMRR